MRRVKKTSQKKIGNLKKKINQWPAWRAINKPVIPSLHGVFIIVFVSIGASVIMLFVARQFLPPTADQSLLIAPRMRIYISRAYGYRVRYPRTWSYEAQPPSSRGEEERIVFSGDSERIIITTTNNRVLSETLIPSLPIAFSLNGIEAFRYHDYDPSNGQPLDRVVIQRPDGRYHELYGYGSSFDQFIMSFSFIR